MAGSTNGKPSAGAAVSFLAAVAGPAWCAATLVAGDHYVLKQAGSWILRSYRPVAAVPAALVTLLLICCRSPKRRALASLAVVVFSVLVWLGDLAYARFFGDLLSAPVLLAAAQAVRVRASTVALIAGRDLALAATNLVAGMVLLAWCTRKARGRPPVVADAMLAAGAAAVLACAVFVIRTDRDPIRLDQQFSHTIVAQRWGVLGYHAIDLAQHAVRRVAAHEFRPQTREEVARWFARTTPQRAASGPTAGALAGRNVVLVLAESLQAFAADLQVNGKPLMPTLRRLRSEGLAFSTVLDQSHEGRTSDAEFMVASSLLPVENGAVAFQFPVNRYVTLAGVLRQRGYSTISAVPFAGDFWNRSVVHPLYGFRESWFAPAFTPSREVGWGLNDRDFLRQAAARLTRARQPYFAFLVTLSLHHPYDDFPEELKDESFGRLEGSRLGNYLHAMQFFDHALADFVDALRTEGALDRVVLVVMGDHDAGFGWDRKLGRLIGARNALDWTLADRVPLVIWAPGSRLPPRTITDVAGQSDLVPTLLGLMGADPAALPFVGRNLLGQPRREPVIRPLGEWADERNLWSTAGGSPHCYDMQTHAVLPDEACAAGAEEAAIERKVSEEVIDFDLQGASQSALDEHAADPAQQ